MTAGRLRELLTDVGDDEEVVILEYNSTRYTLYEISDVLCITHLPNGVRMPQQDAFFAIEGIFDRFKTISEHGDTA